MRAFLAACAVALAALAVVAGVVHFAVRPTSFKVAIPSANTLDQRVFGQAGDMLRTARAPVRIDVVTVENGKAALEQMAAGKAELAVLRSDAALQGEAETVLIVRREAAVLFAPKIGKIQKVSDLPNGMLGIVAEGPIDSGLLGPVLDYYGIPRDKAKYLMMPAAEMANALRQKKVDAVLAVGPVASKQISEVVAEVARAVKGAINFIEIEEANAIAKRIPALEKLEVEQGAFGGRPPRPPESLETLAFSVRLVATQKSDSDKIAELVKQLYLIRQNINAAVAGAGLMETPDLDDPTPFLIHPGTRAYVNGDQKNLLDRYSDWIYLGAFLMSGLGSVVVAVFGYFGGQRDGGGQAPLRKMQELLAAARAAPDVPTLDQLERDADAAFDAVYAQGIKDSLSASALTSFNLGFSELHRCITARRVTLASG
ncbi:MAG: TAXI family TRAP transporter solute-binding subunit [Alphaproteobacteria bacterium]